MFSLFHFFCTYIIPSLVHAFCDGKEAISLLSLFVTHLSFSISYTMRIIHGIFGNICIDVTVVVHLRVFTLFSLQSLHGWDKCSVQSRRTL